MKVLVLALLLGVASSVMASVVPDNVSVGVTRTNVTRKKILVPDFSKSYETKEEDFKDLKRYSNMATKENIAAVRNMERMMQEDPQKLMAQMRELNPNLMVAADEGAFQQVNKAVETDITKVHQQALQQMEEIGRQNLGQKKAPITMTPTVEEIKEMGLDQYLPDGWEELLVNSKDYQEALRKRKASGSTEKVQLNDPKSVEKFVQKFQQK